MHLFHSPISSDSVHKQLRLLCAYENGSVTLRGYRHDDRKPSIEGLWWDTLWTAKLHVESGKLSAVAFQRRSSLTCASYGHGRVQNERVRSDRVRRPLDRAVRPGCKRKCMQIPCYNLTGRLAERECREHSDNLHCS